MTLVGLKGNSEGSDTPKPDVTADGLFAQADKLDRLAARAREQADNIDALSGEVRKLAFFLLLQKKEPA